MIGSFFRDVRKAIDDGIADKNKGYSLGLPRLDRHINLRKKMFYMIMGPTGSGKSAFLHDAFILNPLEQNKGANIKTILFSMERSKSFVLAKWLCRRIFLDTGKLYSLGQMLNWYGDKLTQEALDLIDRYEDYFCYLEEHIEIYEGNRSPNDIFRIVKEYAEAHGEEKQVTEYKKLYSPKNPDELVNIAIDHGGLIKTITAFPTKKQAIDKTVEHGQYFRDFLGYSILWVNQLNRDLSSPIYAKLNSFEPHLDNAKESGTIGEASDIALSVWDPLRYNTEDKFYGDVSKFKSVEMGHKYFRGIKILKNSMGVDDAPVGTVFQGETGTFKELPKSSWIRENWKDQDYERIFSNAYFLKD